MRWLGLLSLAVIVAACGSHAEESAVEPARDDGTPARERAEALIRTYLAPEGVEPPPRRDDSMSGPLPPALGGELQWADPSSPPRAPDHAALLPPCDLIQADARDRLMELTDRYPNVVAPSPRRLAEAREIEDAVRHRGIAHKAVVFAETMVWSVPDTNLERVGWWRDRLEMRQRRLDEANERVQALRAAHRLTGEHDAEAILFAAAVSDVVGQLEALLPGPCSVEWATRMLGVLLEVDERLVWREHGVLWSPEVSGARAQDDGGKGGTR